MGSALRRGACCADKDSGKLSTPDSASTTNSSADSDSDDRGTWGNSIEFFLSTIGFAVGFGNLWRFPYLCFRNGGGAFLIPYVLFLFLCGIPLVFLEMSIGQYAGAGPLGVWSICPLAKGLGIGMVVVSIYCCVYYNVIIMWTLYYLFNSFGKVIPWSGCDNPWNSAECRPFKSSEATTQLCNLTMMANGTSSISYNNMTLCNNQTANSTEETRPPYPAEEFWDNKVLSRSGGIGEFIELRWDLALTLLLAWILVFLCLIKGIKSSGKVVYVTATAPYILLTILLIQGATMKGSLNGVKFYMKPDFNKLLIPSVWTEACAQIFFSLGPAWGGLITMASYNKFNTNIYRFSIAVPLMNCGTSLYAGFVIFCVLGYMAEQAGVDIEKVVDSGPGLVFVAYPYAISNLPVPQLWAVLFFLMILSVGLDSQFAMFETFTTCIFDEFSNVFTTRFRKLFFTGAICLLAYLAGLFCCTHAGIYFFQLMDWYIGIVTLLIISFLECIIIGWLYGADTLYKDIELMIGYQPIAAWKFMWKFITPLIVFVMLIYSLATYNAPIYKKVIPYPMAAIALAWLYGVSSSIPIPAYASYLLFYKTKDEPLTLLEKIKKYSRPSPEWGAKKHHQVPDADNYLPASAEDSIALNEEIASTSCTDEKLENGRRRPEEESLCEKV